MVVELRDLQIRYDGGTVVEGFSLQLRAGEIVGVAGSSGCGKSSLLLAMGGLLPARATVMGLRRVPDQIGYVPQDLLAGLSPFLTVGQQVADAGGVAELDRLGLGGERIRRSYPHQLSGGERQRVLVALAVARKPELILADEPTAHLDAVSEGVVLEALRGAGAAVVIASHRERVFAALGCPVLRLTPMPVMVADGPSAAGGGGEMLTVRGLSKAYAQRDWLLRRRSGKQALADVSLSIGKGETVVLMGPSGAGKSTLARCIAGRESWDAGEVVLRGRAQIVPQEPSESLNPERTVAESLREACGRAEAGPLEAMDLPAGVLGRRARELSEGQRARVAIARTMGAMEGGLLILDESLSGLDGATRGLVLRAIRARQAEQGMSCLVITHDADVAAELGARRVVMRDGRMAG